MADNGAGCHGDDPRLVSFLPPLEEQGPYATAAVKATIVSLASLMEGKAMVLKIIVGVVLAAHGIGHSIGLLGMFKVAAANPAWDGESWLLTGPAGTTATQTVGVLLWTVSMVGFVA